jgi:hypothetical protein
MPSPLAHRRLLFWACVFALIVAALYRRSPTEGMENREVVPKHKHMGALITNDPKTGQDGMLLAQQTISIRKGMGAGASKAFDKLWKMNRDDGMVVRFEVNAEKLEFGCGGKIGGLSVGPGDSGGCKFSENGASLRIMWGRPPGGAFAYIYTPPGALDHQPKEISKASRTSKGRRLRKCGAGLFHDTFEKALAGKGWHTVDLGIKLNRVTRGKDQRAIKSGKAVYLQGNTVYRDGVLLFSIDGVDRKLDGVIWRQMPGLPVSMVSFGVFHGGGCVATRDSELGIRKVQRFEWKD